MFFESFQDPVLMILMAAAIVSLVLGVVGPTAHLVGLEVSPCLL
jgi:hypothetical protein